MRKFFTTIPLLFLFGCVSLVPWVQTHSSKEYKDGARDFAAVLPDGWMRFTMDKYFLITRDGIALDAIAVERLRTKDKLEFTKKKLTEDMLLMDIAEVETDNYKTNKNINSFTIDEDTPTTIGGQEAFVLKYSYQTRSGLPMKGIHYGFKYKNWLYRVRFEAPVQHYYSQTLPVFEQFVKTFRLL